MSGRSAIVRRKITETRVEKQGPRSAGSSDEIASPVESHDTSPRLRPSVVDVYSSESQSESSDGRREGTAAHSHRPLDDSAYARARRPVIRTEDVTGIEKSGLRSMLDKKSDEVRKNLAKTFTFMKKGKNEDMALEGRPLSEATVRPAHGGGDLSSDGANEANNGYDYDGHPASEATSPWEEAGSSLMSPPPMTRLGPVKRWIGSGRPVQRWSKLHKDPELFDPNGDVAIYLCHRDQLPRPRPSFRLSSHIIEATESRELITLLRDGSTDGDDVHVPSLQTHHGRHLEPHGIGYGHGGQPTPPTSENASLVESDGQISYEMFFSPPAGMTSTEQLRFLMAVRNVFATLYHASLVGLGLYEALSDLHARLDAWMPAGEDNLGTMVNYITARGIDDVRDNADMAVSLLAWSESPEVRWEEGWRESFLHCAGMYAQVEACADFKRITPITRALLERASLETQLRVQAAEERLGAFQFGDMWPWSVSTTASTSGPVSVAPAKSSADRLQKFLVQYYTAKFGKWPPLLPKGADKSSAHRQAHGERDEGDAGEDTWLTRTLAQQLLRDFAALYDYLVDRDISWDIGEARASRKHLMVSSSGNKAFDADSPDLPMTDMLIEFDNKHRFPHIPHPYPLVPDSVPASASASATDATLSKTKSAGKKSANARSATNERRVQLAYTEATNLCVLGSDFSHYDFIDAFARFEKSDQIAQVDPATARRGRWILIYGVLQCLATVAVDAPKVRYHEKVSYHLSPRLKGAKIPPWRGRVSQSTGSSSDEASHELSHCWMVPHTWSNGDSAATSGAESSADEGAEHSPPMAGGRPFNFPRPPTAGRTKATPRSSIVSGRSVLGGGAPSSVSGSEAGTRVYVPTSPFSPNHRQAGIRGDSSRSYVARPRGSDRFDGHERFAAPALSAVRGVTPFERPSLDGLSRNYSESHTESLPPLIRDFDFDNLDVIDDHEP